MKPNHALQRTRRERRGCNRCVPWAGSLSLGLYPAYAKHSEAAPEWYGILPQIDAEMSAEPMPFDCERIVYSRRRAAHHDGEVTW